MRMLSIASGSSGNSIYIGNDHTHILVDAGISKKRIEEGLKTIRVHDIRHSHVAYLIYQGVEPLIIKERLGHKDIQMTLNTYGHLYPSQQKKVAEMLDNKR